MSQFNKEKLLIMMDIFDDWFRSIQVNNVDTSEEINGLHRTILEFQRNEFIGNDTYNKLVNGVYQSIIQEIIKLK